MVQFAPAERGAFTISMRIDPSAVALERQQDRWTGSLELAIAQRMRDGSMESTAFVSVPIDFTEEVRQKLLKSGVTVNRTVTLKPEAVQVIVGARDLLSGEMGTVVADAARLPRPPR